MLHAKFQADISISFVLVVIESKHFLFYLLKEKKIVTYTKVELYKYHK